MSYSHFLITRFNIPASNWKLDKNHNQVQNDIWLQKRIDLFERFCLPSVMAQTSKNFKWIVWFDFNSPQILKSKIEEWSQLCCNFVAAYSYDYDYWQNEGLPKYIKENTASKCDYVITSRLDNDDAISIKAIATIQKAFVPNDNTIIDLPNGYCYNLQTELFSKHTIISSPFISYIESTNKPKIETVYREGHPAWIEKAAFIFVNERMWIQVCHDSNIANSQHGKICFNPTPSTFGDIRYRNVSGAKVLKTRLIQEYYLLKHRIKLFLNKRGPQ